MAIFKPDVVPKCVSTRSGEFEDGAEIYLLTEEDYEHNFEKDFFPIKLGYNDVHHYFPIVPKGIMQFLDAYNSVRFHSSNLKKVLKALNDQSPKDTNFQIAVRDTYDTLVTTTTVLSGLNPLTGATLAAGTTGGTQKAFPGMSSSKSSGTPGAAPPKKRRLEQAEKEQPYEVEEEEEEEPDDLVYQNTGEDDDSPQITIKHTTQLKKRETQCFCGKSGFKSADDVDRHRLSVHTGHGKGVNTKTGKPKDYWKCNQCNEVCDDARACWKHFRTNHLKIFIHNCPVEGCSHGNDQKDSIVSHIIRDHKEEEHRDWVEKCYQQNWLRCRHCNKFYVSIKGKKAHQRKCGQPSIKLTCIFEHCNKTYKSQESMDNHVETAHHGKGHKTLCPQCGDRFSSKQSLDRHLENKHQ